MLLATKLFVPRPPAHAVQRTRLFDRLEEAGDAALTLVAAPAGFGKTALVSGWVRQRGRAAAWLSLDADDNDPARFWRYLIEAIRTIDDSIGESALPLLQAPQLPSSEAIATIIINDLAELPQPIACVLDDYHVITEEQIHRSLTFLVEHMPPTVCLIVNTRADPPWPLARLRASDRMAELRAADLSFTSDEARIFLEAAGLSVSDEDIQLLESRTEGWIAGLQMAALSMQDRGDTASFIRDFAGSHRFVLDYLAQEVLDHVSVKTRTFLVQTSILERLSAELCEAVTGMGSSQQIQQMLETFERSNLFTEPLDDERHWYRYHQLFADVLRAQLSELDAARVPELHERASAWFEAHGFDAEAIHHALEAQDFDRAAGLIGRVASATFMVGNQLLVLEWLRRLPEKEVVATPVLALADTWARFVTGDYERLGRSLEVAVEGIDSAAASPEQEALSSQLDGIRSWVAYQTGDLETCVDLAGAALPRMPEEGLVPRRIVASAQGYGLLLLGDTEAARRVAADTIAQSRQHADPLTECLALSLEAQAFLLDGRLEPAARGYVRAVAVGTVGGEALPSASIAQVQLAEVLRERNDLPASEQLLRTTIPACELAGGLPEWVFEGNVTLARVLAAQGDADGSGRAGERAERILEGEIVPQGMVPIVGRALGYRVRHWLASGNVDRAAGWLQQQGISADQPPEASQQPQLDLWVLLAKSLLAQGEHEKAIELVDRVLAAAGDAPRLGITVELAIVKALALEAIGTKPAAEELVAEAVRAAEPEGYVRLFIDEGEAMMKLLERAAPALRDSRPAERLITLLRGGGDPAGASTAGPAVGAPYEELTERELALLRLFAVGRSNREIAAELYLSVNTVKWHARNLYAKLGVNRRVLAVARAKELGIL